MNYKAMAHHVGLVLKLEALFLLFPLLVALVLGEWLMVRSFLWSVVIVLPIGMLISHLPGRETHGVTREGFVFLAVCWVAMSVFGALPYWFSGILASPVDALFESMSGFTTTAATLLVSVESVPRSLLLWRSLTLWIGGMGVLILLVAASLVGWGESAMDGLRIENPGPVPGKLVPKLRSNARILYGIYLGLTLLEVVLLLLGGLPFLDSLTTAMGTVGTGGFSIRDASIAAYGSRYVEGVVIVFMLLSGLNFNIHYFLMVRNWAGIRKSDELRWYLGIIMGSTVLVGINLSALGHGPLPETLWKGLFQVTSITTTTGFSVDAVGSWPPFSRMILFLLMFVGACAGSSGGGLKVSRIILLIREVKRSLFRMAKPRTVYIVRLDGKSVNRPVLHSAVGYFLTYFLLSFLAFLLVSLDNLDFESTVTAVGACINNIGAGMGIAPAGFHDFSPLSKLILAAVMLAGRLEIYPLLALFSLRAWRRI